MTSNPYLSDATAAGATDHVDVAWDRGNDQWWDWYMSLADTRPTAGGRAGRPAGPARCPPTARSRPSWPSPTSCRPGRGFFAAESHVKLPGVLSPGAVERLRLRLRELLDAAVDPAVGFQSLEMMWLTDPLVRAAVLSPRIGGICAALLRADRVRLYHDNALSKEPGAGRTPWHYDAHHFPLDTHDVVTAWAPLQPTPREMGPLAFAAGADTWRLAADIPFDKHGTPTTGGSRRRCGRPGHGSRTGRSPPARSASTPAPACTPRAATGHGAADGAGHDVLRGRSQSRAEPRRWSAATGRSSCPAPGRARSWPASATRWWGMSGPDTAARSLDHWSEAGRPEMEAFYALATEDYRELAAATDWSAALRAVATGDRITLLDVACGSGKWPAALLAAGLDPVLRIEVDLLDPSAFSLAEARSVLAPPFVGVADHQVGIQDLDPAVGPYDVAWAVHALYALPPDELGAGLARMAAAVRPGGLGMVAQATAASHYLAFYEAYRDTVEAAVTPFTTAEQVVEALRGRGIDRRLGVLHYPTRLADMARGRGFPAAVRVRRLADAGEMEAHGPLADYLDGCRDAAGFHFDHEVQLITWSYT